MPDLGNYGVEIITAYAVTVFCLGAFCAWSVRGYYQISKALEQARRAHTHTPPSDDKRG